MTSKKPAKKRRAERAHFIVDGLHVQFERALGQACAKSKLAASIR